MDNKKNEKKPQSCFWYEQCKCLKVCEYYTPLEDEEEIEEELNEKKYDYRNEFFDYAEENELYDN